MRRRSFLAAPLGASLLPAAVSGSDTRVYAYGDGIPYQPAELARLLVTAAEGREIEPDDYSRGGIVETLEKRMAELLGKETAVWLPTGTLANHLAVRLLAAPKHRVVVQAESHLYCDCGDCCQTLSGLNLIPLARDRATYTLAEVEQASNDGLLGRVAAPLGALQIETPVRRRSGETFSFEEMKKITGWARQRKIGTHLDGARLFIESAYTNRPLKEYTAQFDTVYISMYKYFNSPSGAILAGPAGLLSDLYHTRRMFGGGLPHAWPFAALTLRTLDGFEQRFRAAKETSERVLAELSKDSNFEIERIPNGTNIFRLRVVNVNPPVYQFRLEEAGISARPPVGPWQTLQVNETWARVGPAEILSRFRKALG